MNQVYGLEYAINLANQMAVSDALCKADQFMGEHILDLLRDLGGSIYTLIAYAEHLETKSFTPIEFSYSRNYEQRKQMYTDMAHALNELIQGLKTEKYCHPQK